MRAAHRTLIIAVLVVFAAVPGALAVVSDPFGEPEVSDPNWRPSDYARPVLGADGDGRAYWLSFARDDDGDEQAAVYERCGSVWEPRLLGSPADEVLLVGLKVARNGTAMAVWHADTTFYSAVRLPGGAWGAPQEIVSDPDVSNLQFALSDAGAAAASWADTAAVRVALRPAGGSWGDGETVVAASRRHALAMSAGGDALLLTVDGTVTESFYRPAGGSWGGAQEVTATAYPNPPKALLAEFDGLGRAVALVAYREFVDTVYANVRSNGQWADDAAVLDGDIGYDLRGLQALVRHKDGAVAVWDRRPTSSNPNIELVAARLGAGDWETPKAFALKPFHTASVATNDAGEIFVAGTHDVEPTGVTDVRAATAASLTAAWGEPERVSPEAVDSRQYRSAGAATGGGDAFYLGWGVHGGANQRSEVIATRAGVACGGGTPTPTPTATATAEPSVTAEPSATAAPDPLPPAPSSSPPAPPAPPGSGPRAIADFTTLPPASRCVKHRKLRLRLKKPPKGYAVKTVTVKVNGRRVARLKGRQLKKPVLLRKLPRGTFTVTIRITLKKGRGLTETRRYRACA